MESSATIGCLLKQWRMDKVSEPKIKLVALISNYYPFYTRDKKFKYFVWSLIHLIRIQFGPSTLAGDDFILLLKEIF